MSILSLVRSRAFVALLVLGVALAVAAACTGDGGGETPAAGGETPSAHEDESGSATAEIKMVPVIKFDKDVLSIPADTGVAITADNVDDGIPHNFAVYSSRSAADSGEQALVATPICSGPCTDTATVSLSTGEYFFRCDVHPVQMVGTLIVE